MFIRTAGERDLADISALLAETWHATYDPIYGAAGVDEISRRWHSVDWLRQMLRRDRSEFIVADTGTELAGIAYAVTSEEQRDVVELHELDVRPAMQGRGVGGLLLDETVGSFYESRLMRLDVEEKNRRAVAFYEAADFVTVDRKPATQWVDAMVLTMEKQLA
jgi:ribosomal protein S18 acetylase RimI-like enzyme